MVVKIVHDELIATLGSDGQTIDLNAVPPVAIMMVGLQGSGKTTTTAKLARRLTQRDKRKVLMASLDIYRPAAMEQLAVLGRDLDIQTLPIVAGQKPAQIAKRALEAGKLGGYDVVLLDTAGRTTLDEKMIKGQFDLADMREQLLQMANMGGISGLMGMMPGIAKMKNQIANAGLDDKILKRQVAVIDSMTRRERKSPDILKASRKKRIAAGAGVKVEEVNKLLKMHRNMADMMKAMGSGKRGPMAGIAQAMGFGGGMPSAEQMKALAEKMPGGTGPGGMPSLPKDLPTGLRQGLPNLPGLTGLSGKPTLPGLGGFPGLGKKK